MKLSTTLFFILFSTLVFSQTTYNFTPNQNDEQMSCEMIIYDSGGPTGDYMNNDSSFLTIRPLFFVNEFIQLSGTIDLESNFDQLLVFDGLDSNAPLIWNGTGNVTLPDNLRATNQDGALTLFFRSDPSVTQGGFELFATCVDSTFTNPPTTGNSSIIETCQSTFYDSGGPDGPYMNSENDTIVICPDVNGDFMGITFTEVELETSATCNWDKISIYNGNIYNGAPLLFEGCGNTDGSTVPSPELHLEAGDFFLSTAASGCLTFIFESDGSVVKDGYAFNAYCVDAQIHGSIIHDSEIENCATDPNEGAIPSVLVQTSGDGEYYGISGTDGTYKIAVDSGTYNLNVLVDETIWEVCNNNIPVYADGDQDSIAVDFHIQPLIDCPVLSVDLSTPLLRRCFFNTYIVNYCNTGTIEANNAYVEIELDEHMSYNNSSIPLSSQNGNTLVFDIGTIPYNTCETFSFGVYLSCDADLGDAICTEATIYPNDPCETPSTEWDKSSAVVDGYCQSDEFVILTITNAGEDMDEPQEWRLYENGVLVDQGTYQLLANETETFTIPANGSTWQLQADQHPLHPGNSNPNAIIEDCGTDGGGNSAQGFVLIFPQDDADPFVAIDCQEVIGAWDPNDKAALPVGYGTPHYIEANTDLDYKIRFQNTGTDTAFNIIVRDTLSGLLDITTLRPGASSFPYNLSIEEENILVFRFNNIMLPDSNVNEAASHGFLKFKISQMPDLADDNVIENSAAIYFDFNKPVITNTVMHTIGQDFILHTEVVFDQSVKLSVAPNPMLSHSEFRLSKSFNNLRIELYDSVGRLVSEQISNEGNRLVLQRNKLPQGLYFYKLFSGNEAIANGKILMK